MEKEKKPKKRRRWGIIALVAGAAILADVTDIPSKILNSYCNVKSEIYNAFTTSEDERIIGYYEAANYSLEGLPSEKKKELFVDYINNDTTHNYKTFVDEIEPLRLDSIISRISMNDSIHKNPDWIVSMYKGLGRSDKWEVVKEITKDAINLK